MQCRVAVLSDIHYDRAPCDDGAQGCLKGRALLTEAVHYLNACIAPDLVLVLGDLVEAGDTEAGLECLRELRPALDLLAAPVLAVPGNHDPAPEVFYSVFDAPPAWLDAGGVRFVPFVDPEAPEFNAHRPVASLDRFAEARAGFEGALVSVQHVPLFAPGACDCPYNYTNAEEILRVMNACGAGYAISGHYHRGMEVLHANGLVSLVTPALCRAPFRFLEVRFSDGAIAVQGHALPPFHDAP
ncbi:MAG TPA: metallophosphoesterase [Candidatus Hydrogenedentes bacterium]|nr:metallophosphoesterase [Candidatus Hydrogenedentota bacterium]